MVTVCVPHDQSGAPCVDGGELVDSAGPTPPADGPAACLPASNVVALAACAPGMPPSIERKIEKVRVLLARAGDHQGKGMKARRRRASPTDRRRGRARRHAPPHLAGLRLGHHRHAEGRGYLRDV
jgi:hypothetical protein